MASRAPDTLAVAFPSFGLRPLTGDVELSLAGVVWSSLPRPVRVGRVIEHMFDRISGHAASPQRIRHLASSAREWLLQRAALRLWPDNGWFQARCSDCQHDFDLPLRLATAPRKPACPGFPVIEVDTSLGPRRFEAPNGDHEERLAQQPPGGDPTRQLVALCGLHDAAASDAQHFTAADLGAIEAAFEAVCPDVADLVQTRCPDCTAPLTVRIDPLDFAFPRAEGLLREVHLLARAYHWSEAEILALPSARRASYAALIRADDRGGGR